jgi:hypothetical protein
MTFSRIGRTRTQFVGNLDQRGRNVSLGGAFRERHYPVANSAARSFEVVNRLRVPIGVRVRRGRRTAMGKREPSHLIPISPDNAASKDWVILLEAGTIVGPSPHRLRVASATQEKKIVKKYNLFLRSRHFLDVEGYDPRIHAVYFCPQLFKYDADKTLVPLQGEEMGRLIAQALTGGVKARRPWYEPSEKLPDQPVVNTPNDQFETLVVEMPEAQNATGKKPITLVEKQA